MNFKKKLKDLSGRTRDSGFALRPSVESQSRSSRYLHEKPFITAIPCC